MTDFTTLGLAEPLLRALAAEGYSTPTPIQAQAIPALLAGRDILGTAQTGTGKTAAFTLPILDRLARDRAKPAPRSAAALILAPTRELAAQIAESIRTYGRHLHPSVAVVVGGVKPGPQIRALAHGVDVLVATPGRLLDHMGTGAVRLDRTATVILDEADQMLDLGFIPAVRRIMAQVPKVRQTALLSATMPPAIRELARDFLHCPDEIAVAPVSRPIERIAQTVRHVPAAEKRDALVALLTPAEVERAIVFTRTKHGADRVARHLAAAGIGAGAIHGNKSQPQRERTLADFRGGRLRVLVATDIAARGIDVDDVSHVVNFELPNVPESYVHRIGRTARAGKAGIAVSLCDGEERKLLRDIEKLIGRRIPADGPAPEEEPAAAAPARRGRGPGQGARPQAPKAPRAPAPTGARQDRPDRPERADRPARPAQGKPAGNPKRRRGGGAPQAEARGSEAAEGLARMLANAGGEAAPKRRPVRA